MYYESLLLTGYCFRYNFSYADKNNFFCYLSTGRSFYTCEIIGYKDAMELLAMDLLNIFDKKGNIKNKGLFDEKFLECSNVEDTLKSLRDTLNSIDNGLNLKKAKLSIDEFSLKINDIGESPIEWCSLYPEVMPLYLEFDKKDSLERNGNVESYRCIAKENNETWKSYYCRNLDDDDRPVIQAYVCNGNTYYIPCFRKVSIGRFNDSETAIVNAKNHFMWLLYVLFSSKGGNEEIDAINIDDYTINIDLSNPVIVNTFEDFNGIYEKYSDDFKFILDIEEKLKEKRNSVKEDKFSEKFSEMKEKNKVLWDETIKKMINGIYSTNQDQAEHDLLLMLDTLCDEEGYNPDEKALERAGEILEKGSFGFYYRMTHYCY